jgi:hypothetical protein
MKAIGVVGLQVRQPSPCSQRLKDFARDFVSDGLRYLIIKLNIIIIL